MQYCGARMMDTDYSTVAGPEMFQRVVGLPAPKGLDITTVAGHHGPGTGMVWMKMSGNDSVFAKITKNMVPEGNGFHFSIPSGAFGVQKTFADDAHAADWDNVQSLAHPEAYLFQTAAGAEQWDGHFVIDRNQREAYLSASLVK